MNYELRGFKAEGPLTSGKVVAYFTSLEKLEAYLNSHLPIEINGSKVYPIDSVLNGFSGHFVYAVASPIPPIDPT